MLKYFDEYYTVDPVTNDLAPTRQKRSTAVTKRLLPLKTNSTSFSLFSVGIDFGSERLKSCHNGIGVRSHC